MIIKKRLKRWVIKITCHFTYDIFLWLKNCRSCIYTCPFYSILGFLLLIFPCRSKTFLHLDTTPLPMRICKTKVKTVQHGEIFILLTPDVTGHLGWTVLLKESPYLVRHVRLEKCIKPYSNPALHKSPLFDNIF